MKFLMITILLLFGTWATAQQSAKIDSTQSEITKFNDSLYTITEINYFSNGRILSDTSPPVDKETVNNYLDKLIQSWEAIRDKAIRMISEYKQKKE